MHDYSIHRQPKNTVIFALTLVTVALTPKINELINWLATHWAYLGSLAAVTASVTTIFALLVLAFEKCLWKNRIARKFLMVPDLNGKWTVSAHQFQKDGQVASLDWSGEMTIVQSWSRMVIRLKTAQSASASVSASISHEEGNGYRLIFSYKNEPNAEQIRLSIHGGLCELLFNEAIAEAEGQYYTDRNRKTAGTMKLQKVG